jgi:branched-chain amino acid aminotransferase
MKIWINGSLVDGKKAKVSVFDRGFLYGDGVFETMRCYAGHVFRLDKHIDRLNSSLKAVRIKPDFTARYLKDAVYKSLSANRLKSAYIRLSVTRGEGRIGIGCTGSFKPTVVIITKEFEPYPEWMHRRGISCQVVSIRQNEYSPLSGIKTANFLNYILARICAKEASYDEAILANTEGYIAEAATSNIFLVRKGSLFTPSMNSGILPGIARDTVLRATAKMRFHIVEGKIAYRELFKADEVFLTNSLVEVLPVTKIDGKNVGSGTPGDITRLLHISYQKEVIREVLGKPGL